MKIASGAGDAENSARAIGDPASNRSTTSSHGTHASWQTEVANNGRTMATLGSDDKEMGSAIEIDSSREVDGVTIVDVAGRATLGKGYGQPPKTVKNIASRGQKRVLLDLGGVSFIDSYGLNDLVSSYTSATSRGAELRLVNVPERVKYLLQLTRLDSVFDTFEEERAAVLSFSA